MQFLRPENASDAANVTDMIVARENESKMKPRLWAKSIGKFEAKERERLEILFICLERPISINLVLFGLRKKKLEVIQDEMSEIVS